MLLKNKNAVIYGAAGAIGSAVALAFAAEGAKVFLTGRTLSKLVQVADRIREAGGSAEIAVVDATNIRSVEKHLHDLMSRESHWHGSSDYCKAEVSRARLLKSLVWSGRACHSSKCNGREQRRYSSSSLRKSATTPWS